jgi:hypothetical protein
MGISLLAAACGECVFRGEALGTVVDREHHPVAGAKVSTCDRESPTPPAEGDAQCRVATTDDQGRFSVDAQMYRPRAFECALHSVWVQKPGCQDVKQPLTQPLDPKLVVTISCPAAGAAPAASGSAPAAAP